MKPEPPAPDPNYPRWMFHPSKDPVIIHSQAEEAALGREWSRTVVVSLPPQEKKAETVELVSAPAVKRKRGRPPGRKKHAVPESISQSKEPFGAMRGA